MEQKREGDWDADHRHRLERRTAKEREGRDNLVSKLKVRSGTAEMQGCPWKHF